MGSLNVAARSSNFCEWDFKPDVLPTRSRYNTKIINSNRTSAGMANNLHIVELIDTNTKKKDSSRFEFIKIKGKELIEMHKKLVNLDKIGKLQHFKEGWNGNNGLSFDISLVNLFSEIINNLDRQPDIAPTGRKSLQIQYELEDKSYLGFEIFADRMTKLEVPQRKYDKAIVTEKNNNFTDFINESLRGFYEIR